MKRILAVLIGVLGSACATVPDRVACRGVSVVAPAPAGPFPAYIASPTKKDVFVFVHGLGGDPVKTWTSANGAYWPRIVANDPGLADFDVYVYAYETNPRGECLGVPDLATQMRTRLVSDGVFETHERVIFVSHSLGGLIVREMLTTFDEHVLKTPLLLFYGTPGHGAELASLASLLTSCQQVHDVRPEQVNSYIRSLNNGWRHRIRGRVRSRCAIEGFATRGVGRLVKPATAEALCDDVSQTIAGDHFGIVKVDCDRDDPHVFLKHVLNEGRLSPLVLNATSLSVRRITDLGDVGAAVVAPDGKTVFVTGFSSVQVTDVDGAAPRKLFDAFYGSIACAQTHCYFGGAIKEQLGVYRFSIGERPSFMFGGWVEGLDVNHSGDRLVMERRTRDSSGTEIVVHRLADNSQTVERSGPATLGRASWHPDGKSILYVETFKEGVVAQDVATGKQTSLMKPDAETLVDYAAWDAQGRYVLASTRRNNIGEFWILQPDAPPIGPILSDSEIWYGHVRATTNRDTFSAVRGYLRRVLQMVSLERQEEKGVGGYRGATGPFVWSDSERLLHTVRDETGSWIAEYDIHSQQVRRLSPTGAISQPLITSDGRRLVFSMYRHASGESGVWTSPVDRWEPVNLTQLPSLTHAISPDTRRIAFSAYGPEGGLYLTTLEPGGDVRRLLRGSIRQIAFAGPRTVVFKRESDGRRPLCKISVDGGPESCFALDNTDAFVMAPDGRTIAAVTHEPGDQSRLHFIDIASGVVRKVVPIPHWIDTGGGLAWTADGTRIVYAVNTSASASAVQSYRIADGQTEVVLNPSEGRIVFIAASPDARYVIFERHWSSSDAVLLTVTR